MSILKTITKGKIKQPVLTCVYGPDGVGKSTLGAEAPSPVFLGAEQGTANLDVSRLPTPKDFATLRAQIAALTNEKHDFKSIVLDSADWIEPLVWQAVCALDGSDNIEKFGGGYAKGYIKALDLWRELFSDIRTLRQEKEMNIIIIAHCMIKTFNDPSTPAPYDRYQLKLHDKAASLLREFVDSVLFMNHETLGRKEKTSDKKIKAYGDDERALYTRRRPHFDAKNRYGLPFEIKMNEGFMWETLMKHIDSGQPDSLATVKEELIEISSLISNADVKFKMMAAIEKCNNDISALVRIRNHARTLADSTAVQ